MLLTKEADGETFEEVCSTGIAKGLPNNLVRRAYRCTQVGISSYDAAMLWVIDDDQLQPFSLDDLRVISRVGAGIVTSRSDPDTLTYLTSYLKTAKGLWLINDISNYLNPGLLATATELELLITRGEPNESVDISELTSLIELQIDGSNWHGIEQLNGLRSLSMSVGDASKFPQVVSAVEELFVSGSSTSQDLTFLKQPSPLRHLEVSRWGTFDAKSLEATPSLVALHFLECNAVVNAEALLHIPSLDTLSFIDVKSVLPAEPLLGLKTTYLSILGNHAFGPRFLDLSDGRRVWAVEPMKNRSKSVLPWKLTRSDFDLVVVDDQIMLEFTNWGLALARAESLGVNLGEEIDSGQVEELLVSLGLSGGIDSFELDSEADRVIIWFASMAAAKRAVGVIIRHWNDDTTALGPFTVHHHQ